MEDVHQLRVFMAVAENLSFTRAAQALYLTQSAVSHQVSALEKELASPLFVRHGRTISLTRDLPPGLGWMLRPMVSTLPRESLQKTLEATLRAVH